MIFNAQLLSEDERNLIHRESLKILSDVGVKFHSPKALDILKRNGAKIDADSGIAKIPEDMVNAALKSAPKSFVLGARNPDFDFQRFSSALILRWEYRPGSLLYLVWSQGRSHGTGDGVLEFRDDLGDLFREPAENVFMLKVSYWISY